MHFSNGQTANPIDIRGGVRSAFVVVQENVGIIGTRKGDKKTINFLLVFFLMAFCWHLALRLVFAVAGRQWRSGSVKGWQRKLRQCVGSGGGHSARVESWCRVARLLADRSGRCDR
jgi:hypothetical protein